SVAPWRPPLCGQLLYSGGVASIDERLLHIMHTATIRHRGFVYTVPGQLFLDSCSAKTVAPIGCTTHIHQPVSNFHPMRLKASGLPVAVSRRCYPPSRASRLTSRPMITTVARRLSQP